MKPMTAAAVCLFAILGAGASAQNASEPSLELYRIGDLPLESGEAIHDFSIAYMTQGTLNAQKPNAVLMVTAISGNHHRIDYMIGPGKCWIPIIRSSSSPMRSAMKCL
jgi:homoserine O-acetyltransferase/O-succinyltransferase